MRNSEASKTNKEKTKEHFGTKANQSCSTMVIIRRKDVLCQSSSTPRQDDIFNHVTTISKTSTGILSYSCRKMFMTERLIKTRAYLDNNYSCYLACHIAFSRSSLVMCMYCNTILGTQYGEKKSFVGKGDSQSTIL